MHPRVVRVALNAGSTEWRLAVNGPKRHAVLSGPVLAQELRNLRLHQGDVILVNCPPAEQPGPVQTTEEWVSGYCQSNSVAVYLTHAFAGVDIFSVRAYHWTAPYDNPFDLPGAFFFCEGKPLGRSTNGFERMLYQIAHDRPKQIFILGSLFDMAGGLPPDPVPYENERDQLYNVLKAAGTDFIMLDPLPGF
jgi:hypothetical protein